MSKIFQEADVVNHHLTDTTSSNYDDKSKLNIVDSATMFRDTLLLILDDGSPFADAPFVAMIADQYLSNKNQAAYFTTDSGFGAYIKIKNGVAVPNIDLNLEEGLKSRNLRKRIGKRLGKSELTDQEIFKFAVGHELAHLIQGLADHASIEDQNTDHMDDSEVRELEEQVSRYNGSIDGNADIRRAQAYFRLVFGTDITRNSAEADINVGGYSDSEYLSYVNSTPESNADFISLWIIGMSDNTIKTSPQNEGYDIKDWQSWAQDHVVVEADL